MRYSGPTARMLVSGAVLFAMPPWDHWCGKQARRRNMLRYEILELSCGDYLYPASHLQCGSIGAVCRRAELSQVRSRDCVSGIHWFPPVPSAPHQSAATTTPTSQKSARSMVRFSCLRPEDCG